MNYYYNNRENRLQSSKRYYNKNKEKILEYHKLYYRKNKRNSYYYNNREKVKKYLRYKKFPYLKDLEESVQTIKIQRGYFKPFSYSI